MPTPRQAPPHAPLRHPGRRPRRRAPGGGCARGGHARWPVRGRGGHHSNDAGARAGGRRATRPCTDLGTRRLRPPARLRPTSGGQPRPANRSPKERRARTAALEPRRLSRRPDAAGRSLGWTPGALAAAARLARRPSRVCHHCRLGRPQHRQRLRHLERRQRQRGWNSGRRRSLTGGGGGSGASGGGGGGAHFADTDRSLPSATSPSTATPRAGRATRRARPRRSRSPGLHHPQTTSRLRAASPRLTTRRRPHSHG